jgi:hypothetical protein
VQLLSGNNNMEDLILENFAGVEPGYYFFLMVSRPVAT